VPRTFIRLLALCAAVALVAVASSSGVGAQSGGKGGKIDYEALGLWDDGPCDKDRDPLVIGLMTVFESPVLSLEDQALALEASAKAFNKRGGANGACIEVHTCDDGGNVDQAVSCAREVDEAGVVATVNDQGTAGQADVSEYMSQAGIPRVASNVTQMDWTDENAYPLDASGTGSVFTSPESLIKAGKAKQIGLIRVDLAAASALVGLLGDLYEGRATFPYDVPVPGGTTDFSQFILGAEDEGVDGVTLAIGEQEAVQVVRAAQQLDTELLIGGTLGTFPRASVVDLGDFAKQMVFVWSFPPATAGPPVYKALRADLAASGNKALQPNNLKASPMRSWIGLYALLRMIRDAGLEEFSRESIKATVDQARDIPMLNIFGGEDWTPDTTTEGIWKRKGVDTWTIWSWDPKAKFQGKSGNFVRSGKISFNDLMCGSIFGAPAETC
jgi:ABC-type branched-subunit amino acid transport system substrate-binding protein